MQNMSPMQQQYLMRLFMGGMGSPATPFGGTAPGGIPGAGINPAIAAGGAGTMTPQQIMQLHQMMQGQQMAQGPANPLYNQLLSQPIAAQQMSPATMGAVTKATCRSWYAWYAGLVRFAADARSTVVAMLLVIQKASGMTEFQRPNWLQRICAVTFYSFVTL